MSRLTHVDEAGAARMVNVGAKPRTARRAVAQGRVFLSAEALEAIATDKAPKGDVLAAARIAGIMAAKRTSDLIPLCHNVPLSSVQVHLELQPTERSIAITVEVETIDRTGVEMEALTAVSAAALTLYDMLKAIDKEMVITDIRLVEKIGGRSQHQPPPAPVVVVPKGPPAPEDPVARPAAEGLRLLRAGTTDLPRPVEPWRPRRKLAPEALAMVPRVHEVQDTEIPLLEAFLLQDRIACAYLLGDLDLPYAEHSRWFALFNENGVHDGEPEHERSIEAVLLLYSGLSMPAVLTCGGPMEIEALVAGTRNALPRRFYSHIRAEHREAIETCYVPRSFTEMSRMGLDRARWVRAIEPEGVEQLSHRDTAAIMALYRHYPDNFFEPAQLDTGLYFGVRDSNGELVSVAGVHVLTEAFDVAVIGNIVTHSEHRGRGLASRCVARLLESLFERVDQVALNVKVDNASAIACYRKFGFQEHHRFLEGWVQNR